MPAEALDPKAVQAANKIMQAAKAEHNARQDFEAAVSDAVTERARMLIVRGEVRERVADEREMMRAATAYRNAERAVSEALSRLLDTAGEVNFLRITTPGEFDFGFDPTPEGLTTVRTGEGEQNDI